MMKTKFNILYEDNHLIVVVKPQNILSQADNSKDEDIMSQIKDYLKEKYNKPGNVFLGLLHRLDRRVSGVMVFSKTSKAASRLAGEIREQKMKKTYYAIVVGDIEDSGNLKNYLKKVRVNNSYKAIITNDKDTEAKEATLSYKKIKRVLLDGNIFSLIEIDLITGRYNQIRAQLAHINHPIINDFKYTYRLNNYNDELGLACVEIGINHPITKEYLDFQYIPTNGIWDLFVQ